MGDIEPVNASPSHPGNRTYVLVAAVLAVLTAMEVMVFYVQDLKPVLLPTLLVLMVAKFTLVAAFFMHLKYDSRVLSGIFVWGLVVAAGILVSLLAIFGRFAAGA
ncbi:MAG: cytochrome C oxidase subunit IV family protein [Gemmatimonadota bacterium]